MQGNKYDDFNEKSSSEYTKNVRDNLVRYMDLLDLTVMELSDKSGVPLSTLKKILYTEQSDCKLSTVIMLAKSLGISIDELADAETIPEITKQNIITCRSLPQNSIYLIRWFISHQATLYKRDNTQHKKIISVMNPLHTNNELLKVSNNFRQIDISHIPGELKFKVFFGLKLNSDYYMPYYTPHDVLLIANDRTPLPKEHIIILIKDNIFLAKQKRENGIIKYYGIRDEKFRAAEDDIDEVIGYVTYVISDTSEEGTR